MELNSCSEQLGWYKEKIKAKKEKEKHWRILWMRRTNQKLKEQYEEASIAGVSKLIGLDGWTTCGRWHNIEFQK